MMPFYGPNAYDFNIEPTSKVDVENEKCPEEEEDLRFWANSFGCRRSKALFWCQLTRFSGGKAWNMRSIKRMRRDMENLEEAVGGKGAKKVDHVACQVDIGNEDVA